MSCFLGCGADALPHYVVVLLPLLFPFFGGTLPFWS